MKSRALARKYRPVCFNDLVGQDAVVKALVNSIRLHREPSGLIFSGIRGVGKTTIARLYAKTLNCPESQEDDPQPCNRCPSCLAIDSGMHEDVLEIDGASNTSVEDVRRLQESVEYVSQRSVFKVYIIDEVHMLSQSAFNALLKTLEEPPEHVIFIFATTEIGKIPQTIQSRCQTFHLRSLSFQCIVDRIKSVLKQEGITYEEEVVHYVARSGRGSMRDALTALDQVIALSGGELYQKNLAHLNMSFRSRCTAQLLSSLVYKSEQELLKAVQVWEEQGEDIFQLVEACCLYIRHAMVGLSVPEEEIGVYSADLAASEWHSIKKIALGTSRRELGIMFRFMVSCLKELTGASLDRFIVENYGLEWCLSQSEGVGQNSVVSVSKRAKERESEVSSTSEGGDRDLMLDNRISGEMNNRDTPVDIGPDNTFPSSWRALVDRWKQTRPLQARALEDVTVIEFNEAKILLAVKKDSWAEKKLSDAAQRVQILAELKAVADFDGELHVVEANEDGEMGISVLEEKNLEKEKINQKIKDNLANHQVTSRALAKFSARIEGIEPHPG